MKILIADDKMSIRKAMKKILNNLGLFDIFQAEDGRTAWKMIKDDIRDLGTPSFDLVISDMEMPDMNGLELLHAVRTDETAKKMPFIMATTVTEKKIILKTMQLGVQAYIIKPFDADIVEIKLKQAGIL